MNSRDLLAGAGIGAALAFIFDPNRGNRRRALMRDKMARAVRATGDSLETTARDVGNRARGVAAATSRRFTDEQVDDATLIERVRSVLGRCCSHPRAIDLSVRDGAVTLRGPILAHEIDKVASLVGGVRGVRELINQLEAHESAEGVPSLQGSRRIAKPRLEILQGRWPPATRALVSVSALATGLCLAAYARRAS
jgi:gas vesicle protein